MRIEGVWTAMVTPFSQDGKEIDWNGFKANIRFQIEAGVDGLVILGTTGESPTISADEREAVIRCAVAESASRVPVMVGTGTNCTRSTIEASHQAKQLGACAALVVTPYYNNPSQDGVYAHFNAIAEAVDLPICAYHHPGRTGFTMDEETLLGILELDSVLAIKEASSNMLQIQNACGLAQTREKTCLSGNDELLLATIAVGGHGVISVASNIAPVQICDLVRLARAGKMVEARALQEKLQWLFSALVVESNPIPIKAAMAALSMAAGPCRLPMTPLGYDNQDVFFALLEQGLDHLGLLEASVVE